MRAQVKLAILPVNVKLPAILIRNLRPDEHIPFIHGLESMSLDPRWVWVAVHRSKIRGVLIAADIHKTLYILRIVVPKGAPRSTLLLLLRQVRKSAYSRGLRVWTAFLMPSPDTPNEEKLTKIAAQMQAQIIPVFGAWAVGKI